MKLPGLLPLAIGGIAAYLVYDKWYKPLKAQQAATATKGFTYWGNTFTGYPEQVAYPQRFASYSYGEDYRHTHAPQMYGFDLQGQ